MVQSLHVPVLANWLRTPTDDLQTIFSREIDDMADDLTARLGDLLKNKPWYELPRLLADVRLYQIREELRAKNLYDTQEPPEPRQEIPTNLDPALRQERTIDGTYNDLNFPKMGSAGCRFGRNFPLDQVSPDVPNLLIRIRGW